MWIVYTDYILNGQATDWPVSLPCMYFQPLVMSNLACFISDRLPDKKV